MENADARQGAGPTISNFGKRAFVVSLGLAGIGVIAFAVGVGAAFSRAGNWSNYVAGLGIFLIVLGGISNIVATVFGFVVWFKNDRVSWWWPLSLLGTAGSFYGGWVALQL